MNNSFLWGVASSALQIEGSTDREESIWDAFAKIPNTIKNGDNFDIACDHYNRYEEDIKLIADMGIKNYRFSISWCRIIKYPSREINQKGIDFYNNVINCLIKYKITPIVTIYHWDEPQYLFIKYNSWLNKEVMINEYMGFANILFIHFGDRVKHWITFNEPWCSAMLGYNTGVFAPGLTSYDSSKGFIVAHNILLAHAKTVQMYKRDFKFQKGIIGITLNSGFSFAKYDSNPIQNQLNRDAAQRALIFSLGWFADPIYFGDYPDLLKEKFKGIIPEFTDEEKLLIKDSSDFFGLNTYTSDIIEHSTEVGKIDDWGNKINCSIYDILQIKSTTDPLWELSDLDWPIVPDGFKQLLLWINDRYKPRGGIYITENGIACKEDTDEDAIYDINRSYYLDSYIDAMKEAIDENVNVRAYMVWTILDNVEWVWGRTKRFGLISVDYETQKRTIKNSFRWFSDFINKKHN